MMPLGWYGSFRAQAKRSDEFNLTFVSGLQLVRVRSLLQVEGDRLSLSFILFEPMFRMEANLGYRGAKEVLDWVVAKAKAEGFKQLHLHAPRNRDHDDWAYGPSHLFMRTIRLDRPTLHVAWPDEVVHSFSPASGEGPALRVFHGEA